MRSAITVAGIDGYDRNNARTDGSTCAHAESAARARSYCGGPDDRNAFATVLRDNPNRRAICACAIPSEPCNRRINAQSSTVITPPSSR